MTGEFPGRGRCVITQRQTPAEGRGHVISRVTRREQKPHCCGKESQGMRCMTAASGVGAVKGTSLPFDSQHQK